MAYANLRYKLIGMPKPILRDVIVPINTTNTEVLVDLVQEHKALGLDFMLVNNGTGTVSVYIDGAADAIDIEGGDSFSFSGIIFARIKITNSGGNSIVGLIAGKKVID